MDAGHGQRRRGREELNNNDADGQLLQPPKEQSSMKLSDEARIRGRQFPWFRLYSDFTRHPRWTVVARLAHARRSEVIAIAIDLLCAANRARPRGSLMNMNVADCGAALTLAHDTVCRVYAALESVGWIQQDFIVTWDERQPEREDHTAAARMKRYRDRKKAARKTSAISIRALRRNTVTVTHRVEERFRVNGESGAGTVTAALTDGQQSRLSDDGVDWKAELEHDGLATVMRRRSVDKKAANTILMRWLISLKYDYQQLCVMLREAELCDLRGAAFETVIGDWIKEKQPHLRLGPTMATRHNDGSDERH
jgi:hypothetical protein